MTNESTFAHEVGAGAATVAVAAALLWLIGTLAGPGAVLGLCRSMTGGACQPLMREALQASIFWTPFLSGMLWFTLFAVVATGAFIAMLALSELGRDVLSVVPRKIVR